jgi:hypothetical protein
VRVIRTWTAVVVEELDRRIKTRHARPVAHRSVYHFHFTFLWKRVVRRYVRLRCTSNEHRTPARVNSEHCRNVVLRKRFYIFPPHHHPSYAVRTYETKIFSVQTNAIKTDNEIRSVKRCRMYELRYFTGSSRTRRVTGKNGEDICCEKKIR